MQLPFVSPSESHAAVRRRLSKALQLEAYFRGLLSEYRGSEPRGDEVFGQWSASRKLVGRALQEYAAILRPALHPVSQNKDSKPTLPPPM
jgi:hypothetical protein